MRKRFVMYADGGSGDTDSISELQDWVSNNQPSGTAYLRIEPKSAIEVGKSIDMVWANEAGRCFRFVQGPYDRLIVEIFGVVDGQETLLAHATIERHNRNRVAQIIGILD